MATRAALSVDMPMLIVTALLTPSFSLR